MRRSPMPPARSVRPRFGRLAAATGATVALPGRSPSPSDSSSPVPSPALSPLDADSGSRADASGGAGVPGGSASPLPLRRLLAPLPALPRLRRLFDPRGWFRSLEREVNFQLSAHVYPRVPGIARPYASQLDRLLTLSEAEIRIADLPASFDGTTVL
jgi:hypothetical protein